MKLAEAFGVRGMQVTDPRALQAALQEATSTATAAPTLIEVPVGPLPTPY